MNNNMNTSNTEKEMLSPLLSPSLSTLSSSSSSTITAVSSSSSASSSSSSSILSSPSTSNQYTISTNYWNDLSTDISINMDSDDEYNEQFPLANELSEFVYPAEQNQFDKIHKSPIQTVGLAIKRTLKIQSSSDDNLSKFTGHVGNRLVTPSLKDVQNQRVNEMLSNEEIDKLKDSKKENEKSHINTNNNNNKNISKYDITDDENRLKDLFFKKLKLQNDNIENIAERLTIKDFENTINLLKNSIDTMSSSKNKSIDSGGYDDLQKGTNIMCDNNTKDMLLLNKNNPINFDKQLNGCHEENNIPVVYELPTKNLHKNNKQIDNDANQMIKKNNSIEMFPIHQQQEQNTKQQQRNINQSHNSAIVDKGKGIQDENEMKIKQKEYPYKKIPSIVQANNHHTIINNLKHNNNNNNNDIVDGEATTASVVDDDDDDVTETVSGNVNKKKDIVICDAVVVDDRLENLQSALLLLSEQYEDVNNEEYNGDGNSNNEDVLKSIIELNSTHNNKYNKCCRTLSGFSELNGISTNDAKLLLIDNQTSNNNQDDDAVKNEFNKSFLNDISTQKSIVSSSAIDVGINEVITVGDEPIISTTVKNATEKRNAEQINCVHSSVKNSGKNECIHHRHQCCCDNIAAKDLVQCTYHFNGKTDISPCYTDIIPPATQFTSNNCTFHNYNNNNNNNKKNTCNNNNNNNNNKNDISKCNMVSCVCTVDGNGGVYSQYTFSPHALTNVCDSACSEQQIIPLWEPHHVHKLSICHPHDKINTNAKCIINKNSISRKHNQDSECVDVNDSTDSTAADTITNTIKNSSTNAIRDCVGICEKQSQGGNNHFQTKTESLTHNNKIDSERQSSEKDVFVLSTVENQLKLNSVQQTTAADCSTTTTATAATAATAVNDDDDEADDDDADENEENFLDAVNENNNNIKTFDIKKEFSIKIKKEKSKFNHSELFDCNKDKRKLVVHHQCNNNNKSNNNKHIICKNNKNISSISKNISSNEKSCENLCESENLFCTNKTKHFCIINNNLFNCNKKNNYYCYNRQDEDNVGDDDANDNEYNNRKNNFINNLSEKCNNPYGEGGGNGEDVDDDDDDDGVNVTFNTHIELLLNNNQCSDSNELKCCDREDLDKQNLNDINKKFATIITSESPPSTSSSSSTISAQSISPNSEYFEGSNRLQRLEKRFKDFTFTKRLPNQASSSSSSSSSSSTITSSTETSPILFSETSEDQKIKSLKTNDIILNEQQNILKTGNLLSNNNIDCTTTQKTNNQTSLNYENNKIKCTENEYIENRKTYIDKTNSEFPNDILEKEKYTKDIIVDVDAAAAAAATTSGSSFTNSSDLNGNDISTDFIGKSSSFCDKISNNINNNNNNNNNNISTGTATTTNTIAKENNTVVNYLNDDKNDEKIHLTLDEKQFLNYIPYNTSTITASSSSSSTKTKTTTLPTSDIITTTSSTIRDSIINPIATTNEKNNYFDVGTLENNNHPFDKKDHIEISCDNNNNNKNIKCDTIYYNNNAEKGDGNCNNSELLNNNNFGLINETAPINCILSDLTNPSSTSSSSNFVFKEEIYDDNNSNTDDNDNIIDGELKTNCEFNVKDLPKYSRSHLNHIFECYDELIDSENSDYDEYEDDNNNSDCEYLKNDNNNNNNNNCDNIRSKDNIRILPVYCPFSIMRDTSGPLRGLLKKPNRPPTTRKNRVVFDETKNEFFDADYIILIREDCPYDEEDEEPCTCGEHELVRLCCEEGCQCSGYVDESTTTRTPQSPKFAPPIEFVDQAALSPPEGYKDGNGNNSTVKGTTNDNAGGGGGGGGESGTISNALGGALGGHVFGAQHIQQLQVIQRLQAQRAAMLAARTTTGTGNVGVAVGGGGAGQTQHGTTNNQHKPHQHQHQQAQQPQQKQPPEQQQQPSPVCSECAECAECAAKYELHDEDCNSPYLDENQQLDIPHVALVPIQTGSPERRITQKEIIAGEERPKYLMIKQLQEQQLQQQQQQPQIHPQQLQNPSSMVPPPHSVTERRIIREATETTTPATPQIQAATATSTPIPSKSNVTCTIAGGLDENNGVQHHNTSSINDRNNAFAGHFNNGNSLIGTAAQITGILKGGKLWKTEQSCEEQTNTNSDDENSKRSVRFTDHLKSENGTLMEDTDRDTICDGQANTESTDENNLGQMPEITPMKKHSSLFHNALRPNSAVRQLFPATTATVQPLPTTPLTHEALRAFEESKRTQLSNTHIHTTDSETDTIRRTIERNALRRSLIKYEPKKKVQRPDTSLEERIRQLTCDVDDEPNTDMSNDTSESDNNNNKMINNNNNNNNNNNGNNLSSESYDIENLERRNSPAGEENPQQPKYQLDKSFSPSSSVSSSSSSSISGYRKITEIFSRERRQQERIPEADENPIIIIPQECRCPAAPDLGMGIQMPAAHTQIHQTPPRQNEPRRQFLSTLAPLTACVAGQRDDLSYYTLAPGDRTSTASSQCSEYSLGDIEAVLHNVDDMKKVAPDVIAGTPGQENQHQQQHQQQHQHNHHHHHHHQQHQHHQQLQQQQQQQQQQQDELAAFAQQEAPRTERLKKRYSAETSLSAPNSNAGSDDDEQNDYGFNKRPSVRGIKPRFSSTNEILQQMQAQLANPNPIQLQNQQLSQAHNLPAHQIQCNTLPKNHTTTLSTPKSQHPLLPLSSQQQQQQQAVTPWNYYGSDTLPRNQNQNNNPHSNYYQHVPIHARHSYHGHEEATIFQNCSTVALEQHYDRTYARSPTRRPESPPPLRNYHQTMVLIPYNAESYAHFSSNEQPLPGYQRHNILEYQQVTQQTIRVPMGYPLPGMQLHVVAGRGTGHQPFPQYSRQPPQPVPSKLQQPAILQSQQQQQQQQSQQNNNQQQQQQQQQVQHQKTQLQHNKNLQQQVHQQQLQQAHHHHHHHHHHQTPPPPPPRYTPYVEKSARATGERGVPEGAASVIQNDSKNALLSPTSHNNNTNNNTINNNNNNMMNTFNNSTVTTTTVTTSSPLSSSQNSVQPGPVFYAMNV